jgi:medium-chain acyl-[acyl-carrier-protein] hydrolase
VPKIPQYLIFEPRPRASVHLYCLPYGGGSAAVYRPWARELPPEFELRALHLPGWLHTPGDEPGDWTDLVAAITDTLEQHNSRTPYVLFGHCMGGLVGFHVAHEMRRRGAAQPMLLGISGWPAEDNDRMLAPFLEQPRHELTSWLRTLGGVPDHAGATPDVVSRAIDAACFDLRVALTRPAVPAALLDCPVAAYTGAADPLVRPAQLDEWRRRTACFLGVTTFEGGHFYLRSGGSHALRALLADLRRCQPPATDARDDDSLPEPNSLQRSHR